MEKKKLVVDAGKQQAFTLAETPPDYFLPSKLLSEIMDGHGEKLLKNFCDESDATGGRYNFLPVLWEKLRTGLLQDKDEIIQYTLRAMINKADADTEKKVLLEKLTRSGVLDTVIQFMRPLYNGKCRMPDMCSYLRGPGKKKKAEVVELSRPELVDDVFQTANLSTDGLFYEVVIDVKKWARGKLLGLRFCNDEDTESPGWNKNGKHVCISIYS